MRWLAGTAFGLEGPTANELRRLGMASVQPLDTGGVVFEGTSADALKSMLWLRTADRVMLIAEEEKVLSFEDLFRLVNRFPWEKYLPRNAKFPIRAHCVRSQLMSPSDCQSIVKKAICKRLSQIYHIEFLPERGDLYPIDVSIRKDIARICIDASGDALNKRGYRTWNGEAPLRETLAAALVETSPWRKGMALYDPMCGTGTIPIEAAMIATNRAAGLNRSFTIEKWPMLKNEELLSIREEAEKAYSADSGLCIAGSDIAPDVADLARKHVQQAGFKGRISIEVCDARDVVLPENRGVIICNPPYGERLGDERFALQAAGILGRIWKNNPGWSVCALSSVPGFEKAFGRRSDKKRRFYNGRIECEYMTFFSKEKPIPHSHNGGIDQ